MAVERISEIVPFLEKKAQTLGVEIGELLEQGEDDKAQQGATARHEIYGLLRSGDVERLQKLGQKAGKILERLQVEDPPPSVFPILLENMEVTEESLLPSQTVKVLIDSALIYIRGKVTNLNHQISEAHEERDWEEAARLSEIMTSLQSHHQVVTKNAKTELEKLKVDDSKPIPFKPLLQKIGLLGVKVPTLKAEEKKPEVLPDAEKKITSWVIDTELQTLTINGKDIGLTQEQFIVAARLTEEVGRFVSPDRLINEIQGTPYGKITRGMRTAYANYVRGIRNKVDRTLGIDHPEEIIVKDSLMGYKLLLPPEAQQEQETQPEREIIPVVEEKISEAPCLINLYDGSMVINPKDSNRRVTCCSSIEALFLLHFLASKGSGTFSSVEEIAAYFYGINENRVTDGQTKTVLGFIRAARMLLEDDPKSPQLLISEDKQEDRFCFTINVDYTDRSFVREAKKAAGPQKVVITIAECAELARLLAIKATNIRKGGFKFSVEAQNRLGAFWGDWCQLTDIDVAEFNHTEAIDNLKEKLLVLCENPDEALETFKSNLPVKKLLRLASKVEEGSERQAFLEEVLGLSGGFMYAIRADGSLQRIRQ